MSEADIEPVVVVDYDPAWPAEFERLRARAADTLGDEVLAVHHVGSTAVPGLPAKPIIDLDVVVRSQASVEVAIARLAAIGYEYLGDQGVADRYAFAWPSGEQRHHLYVCVEGTAELERHLRFRDYLRTHRGAAERYAVAKKKAASTFRVDREGYGAAKQEVIEAILRAADDSAQTTSFAYSRDLIASVYDAYGDSEWDRHEASAASRAAFRIHLHYLHEHIEPGAKVLEIGAGAGRFTVELAQIGASITVADISPTQLRLNAQHVAEAGFESYVEDRFEADICDLSSIPDDSFDAVVCIGGPLSYVVGRTDQAMSELTRVVKPGGKLVLSAMSHFGTFRAFAPGVAREIDEFGLSEMQEIFATGDLPSHHSTIGPMHLFCWAELSALIGRHGKILSSTATNFLSLGDAETCERWAADPAMFEVLVEWEIQACAQPGAIDGGTHILVVAEAT